MVIPPFLFIRKKEEKSKKAEFPKENSALCLYTLRKSNSNHVSVALPYSSTACG